MTSEILDAATRWATGLAARGLVPLPRVELLRAGIAEANTEGVAAEPAPFLVVMLCGPTGVGKSSLINLLAGAAISKVGLGATTSAAMVYVHQDDDIAKLFESGIAFGQLALSSANVVRHNREELLHKVLVDTPDIDSVVQEHRQTTAALMHGADIVLMVTSPERYKVLQSAEWIRAQRGQRALAFVLNKWDRESLGLQHERRSVIEEDFRKTLTSLGFVDPHLFKLSTLGAGVGETGHEVESDLADLRSWLQDGLDRSAAKAVIGQRRRMAWGRLAAAVVQAQPTPLDDGPFASDAVERLDAAYAQALAHSALEANGLHISALEGQVVPMTPGLLGMGQRTGLRSGGMMGLALRFALARLVGLGASQDGRPSALATDGFGLIASQSVTAAQVEILDLAQVSHVPLGPVSEEWRAAGGTLQQRLAGLPAQGVAAIEAAAVKPSARRFAGLLVITLIEVGAGLVVLTTIGQLGWGLAKGVYAPGSLVLQSLALLLLLSLLGGWLTNLFFPSREKGFRNWVVQRAAAAINETKESVKNSLVEQARHRTSLAADGLNLLASIDVTMRSAVEPMASPNVVRLFGLESAGPLGTPEHSGGTIARASPVFD